LIFYSGIIQQAYQVSAAIILHDGIEMFFIWSITAQSQGHSSA
jgi:hypothetical protein